MIGTRILKINSEIAEIFDAKVATPHSNDAVIKTVKSITVLEVETCHTQFELTSSL